MFPFVPYLPVWLYSCPYSSKRLFNETLSQLQDVCYVLFYKSETFSRPAIYMTPKENERKYIHSKINRLNINNRTEENIKEGESN